jgi:hypothetical protein
MLQSASQPTVSPKLHPLSRKDQRKWESLKTTEVVPRPGYMSGCRVCLLPAIYPVFLLVIGLLRQPAKSRFASRLCTTQVARRGGGKLGTSRPWWHNSVYFLPKMDLRISCRMKPSLCACSCLPERHVLRRKDKVDALTSSLIRMKNFYAMGQCYSELMYATIQQCRTNMCLVTPPQLVRPDAPHHADLTGKMIHPWLAVHDACRNLVWKVIDALKTWAEIWKEDYDYSTLHAT